ncbi:hypothetical protein FIU92_01155 [Ruegeria sp. THAF33]|nr:hypothetical protein FIU92_01155 [Ruegeria sp. THAF33]
MIEMTTNPAAQMAILRAHQERSRVVWQFCGWIFGSR